MPDGSPPGHRLHQFTRGLRHAWTALPIRLPLAYGALAVVLGAALIGIVAVLHLSASTLPPEGGATDLQVAPPSTEQPTSPSSLHEPAPAPDEPALASLAQAPATESPAPTADSARPILHTVQPGESLRTLADRYGISPETILHANNLANPDLLRVGQDLRILPVDGVLHTVAPGETLRHIATRYEIDLADIAATNRLPNPDLVPVGTDLVIPGAAPADAPEDMAAAESGEAQQAASVHQAAPLPSATPAPPPRPSPAARTYEVQPGDSLRGIAERFGVELSALLASNGIDDPDRIAPGRSLRIPPPNAVEYTVQSGETLADVAWKLRVSLGVLLEANGIANPDLVPVGTTLIVPGGQLRPEARTTSAAPAPRPTLAAVVPLFPQATAVPVPPPPPRPQPTAAPPARTAPPAAPSSAPVATTGARVITAKVTGYAFGADNGAVGTRTASGTTTHWGTVAADVRRYPFGTRVMIEGFEDTVFVVEDTGSAVIGDIFDIWFPDLATARRFGTQTRQVTILP